jgi:Co/Zn/Cd efflux system component/copper chaperone CopZ
MTAAELGSPVRYRVTGMDCSACATKIEGAARKVAGVEGVRVSIASQEMTLRVKDEATPLPELERTITGLGYRLTRLGGPGVEDDRIPDLTHVTPAYKRALWIVVLLNAGYGIIEIVGGFIAGSQSLKADALDFIGDGLISLLGLIAVGWGLAARAKTALLQGVFLGVLGVGVLAATAYRIFFLQQPEAQLMGIFGSIGLAVNIAAAVVLLPHRHGDANVRAIWLFSRNDAIGNIAVIIAAVLVAWTQTPWPDLLVAVVIAGLFLQSAYSIVKDAREDLRTAERSGRRMVPD